MPAVGAKSRQWANRDVGVCVSFYCWALPSSFWDKLWFYYLAARCSSQPHKRSTAFQVPPRALLYWFFSTKSPVKTSRDEFFPLVSREAVTAAGCSCCCHVGVSVPSAWCDSSIAGDSGLRARKCAVTPTARASRSIRLVLRNSSDQRGEQGEGSEEGLGLGLREALSILGQNSPKLQPSSLVHCLMAWNWINIPNAANWRSPQGTPGSPSFSLLRPFLCHCLFTRELGTWGAQTEARAQKWASFPIWWLEEHCLSIFSISSWMFGVGRSFNFFFFLVQRHNYTSLINLQTESSACHKSLKQTCLFIFYRSS